MSGPPDIMVLSMKDGFPSSCRLIRDSAKLFVMIGTKGHLAAEDAEETALFLLNAMASTTCPIGFCIGGYDDDPRELTSIPEAMAYWRLVMVKFSQVADLQTLLRRFDADSAALAQIAFGLAGPLPPTELPMSRRDRRKRQSMQRRAR